MVKTEAPTYYCTCAILWTTLGISDYIFDSIEPDPRSAEDYGKINDLSEWLLGEIFSADERGDILPGKIEKLHGREFEDFSDQVTFKWAEMLLSFAKDVSEQWNLSQSIILYYLLTMVELEALANFQAVISDLTSRQLRQYYDEKRTDFDTLAEYLRSEMLRLKADNDISWMQISKMQAATNPLIRDWKIKVSQLAQSMT